MRNFNAWAILITSALMTSDILQPGYLTFYVPQPQATLNRALDRYTDWSDQRNQKIMRTLEKETITVEGVLSQ